MADVITGSSGTASLSQQIGVKSNPKRKDMKSARKTKRKKAVKITKPRIARPEKDPRVAGWKRRGIELTPEAYDDMLNAQGGLCAVCKRPPGVKRLAPDHDHSTGLVRGLLCWFDNRHVIGRHRTPERLQAGADYLRRHLEKVAANTATNSAAA